MNGLRVVLAMCAWMLSVSVARAGQWEIVEETDTSRWDELRQGTTSGHAEDEPPNGQTPAPTAPYTLPWQTPRTGWPYGSYRAERSNGGYEGSALVNFDGTARSILKWVPAHANDKAPLFVIVGMNAGVHAKTSSQSYSALPMNAKIHAQGSIEKPAQVTVAGNAVGNVVLNANTLIGLSAGGMGLESQYVSQDLIAEIWGGKKFFMLLMVPPGTTEIKLPWIELKAKSTLDGGRSGYIPYYNSQHFVKLLGSAAADVVFTSSHGYAHFTPNPAGLPLAECNPTPTPVATPQPSPVPLNQIIVEAAPGTNGEAFLIECRVSMGSMDNAFHDPLRDGFGWEIERAPLPLLSIAPNGFTSSSNGVSVFRRSYVPLSGSPTPAPQFTPTPGPTATPTPQPTPTATPYPGATPTPTPNIINGMGFDLRGGLPASNGAFGLNKIFHFFNHTPNAPFPALTRQVIATADVALFYEAEDDNNPLYNPNGAYGYDHYSPAYPLNPNEGDLEINGVHAIIDHFQIRTPNWFYYYSQVFTAPYGFEINYRKGQDSGYFPGQNHIHIGDMAHGLGSVQLMAIPPGQQYAVHVGEQTSWGLDTFARNVTHECTHKRIYELLQQAIQNAPPGTNPDNDNDGVLDSLETAVGLDPNVKTTVPGSAAWDSNNSAEPDNEAFCRMTERDLYADINKDWAGGTGGGLNWKGLLPIYRYLRCQRSGPPRQEDLNTEYQGQGLDWRDARAAAS